MTGLFWMLVLGWSAIFGLAFSVLYIMGVVCQ